MPLPHRDGVTLQALLEATPCDLYEIWDSLRASQPATSRQSAETQTGVLLAEHMLMELAKNYVSGIREQPSMSAYALHMTLPSGEYFTNAVHLDEKQAESLSRGYADLVAIAPPIRTESVVTLGERVRSGPPPSIPTQPRGPIMHASTFRSYGAYGSSLGPSSDSMGQTLRARPAELVWQMQQRTTHRRTPRWGAPLAAAVDRAYRTDPALEAMETDNDNDDNDEEEETEETTSHALATDAAALDPALDAALLEQALDTLEIDHMLSANAARLDELQELQWLRVRMDYGHATSEQASRREQELAETLLASLVGLLCRLPPSALGTAVARHGPLWHMTQTALASSLAKPSQVPGYWGTVPEGYAGVRTQVTLAPPPSATDPSTTPTPTWAALVRPRVVVTNETARPTSATVPLLSSYDQFQGSPVVAVKAMMTQARPPPPTPAYMGVGRPPLGYLPSQAPFSTMPRPPTNVAPIVQPARVVPGSVARPPLPN